MSVAAYILLSLLTMLSAFVAYMWYITPSPKDLAEDILRAADALGGFDTGHKGALSMRGGDEALASR